MEGYGGLICFGKGHQRVKATSIKQTQSAAPERTVSERGIKCLVPDFRNMGTLLRIVLLGNALLLITALMRAPSLAGLGREFLELAARAELPLLMFVLLIYFCGTWLQRLNWRDLSLISSCTAVFLAVVSQSFFFPPATADAYLLGLLWALGAVATMVCYLHWRQIAQMPALDEARILALTSRIRPHFFFNSINGVLGVMRADPKRAEQALESLAELFRDLMRDSRNLVTLCDEIELCNRYLELERLRLGDRLQVKWELKYAPLNALVPPLMLQPLIENAVYHGIEPNVESGTILVRIIRKGNVLDVRISNPVFEGFQRAAGNRMALGNIRERLQLFFDLEATLTTEVQDKEFVVKIRMPLRREEK